MSRTPRRLRRTGEGRRWSARPSRRRQTDEVRDPDPLQPRAVGPPDRLVHRRGQGGVPGGARPDGPRVRGPADRDPRLRRAGHRGGPGRSAVLDALPLEPGGPPHHRGSVRRVQGAPRRVLPDRLRHAASVPRRSRRCSPSPAGWSSCARRCGAAATTIEPRRPRARLARLRAGRAGRPGPSLRRLRRRRGRRAGGAARRGPAVARRGSAGQPGGLADDRGHASAGRPLAQRARPVEPRAARRRGDAPGDLLLAPDGRRPRASATTR